ncbi:class I SAM-dependent methyltransferase [Gorillibacterium timonense]|uniref:class I SAM-dependent methyltransferase n=1 Tax=Gorillibacterium timonense TaxID=1689269 RepID=UPI00071CD9BC|nr:class I SAM-dependent methyltransferase [Gorillibacterium timonense]
MLVTTSYYATPSTREEARRLAAKSGGRYVDRRRDSLPDLRKKYGDQGILLLTEEKMMYCPVSGDPIYFHPSTAYIRVKRMTKGESDPLVDLSGVRPGDRVLDCTAGLASDSIVFAHAVGDSGKVTALESEAITVLLLEEGLVHYEAKFQAVNEAMRRIEVVHTFHLDYLRKLPDKSYDIVYFDPMFRIPVEESSSISPYREIANPDPLTLEAVEEAKRVAIRRVLLKEHRDSPEYERLGFLKHRSRTKIAYGVIEL